MTHEALVDDLELEALMNELENQNKEMAATAAATPVAEVAEIVPIVKAAAVVADEELVIAAVESDEGLSASDLDDLASLEAELEEPVVVAPVVAAEVLLTPAVVVEVEQVSEAMLPTAVEKISAVAETELAVVMTPAKRVNPLSYEPDVKAFNRETAVTEATLNNCMIEQSGLRAYHGAQHAYSEAQAAKVKLRYEILEAGLYDAHRKALLDDGEKITEKLVEAAVKQDPQWKKAKMLLIEAETYAAIHKGFVASLQDRRDMLIQRGADRRAELQGQTRTIAKEEFVQVERDNFADRAKKLANAALNR